MPLILEKHAAERPWLTHEAKYVAIVDYSNDQTIETKTCIAIIYRKTLCHGSR